MSLERTDYSATIHKVGGYYNFVTMINRRIKELNNGEPPMVMPDSPAEFDHIDLVVREIDQDLLVLDTSDAPPVPAASTTP